MNRSSPANRGASGPPDMLLNRVKAQRRNCLTQLRNYLAYEERSNTTFWCQAFSLNSILLLWSEMILKPTTPGIVSTLKGVDRIINLYLLLDEVRRAAMPESVR